jgi:GNAT superfamily N-acetyltransferase
MAYEIREIVASEHLPQAKHLLDQHYDELVADKALMVLNPDIPTYQMMERAGMMLSLGLFDGDELVGYSINIISKNLHYADLTMCQNDLLYLQPAHRGAQAGIFLIHATEEAAYGHGANIMLWHAKENTALAHLLPKLGCRVLDVMYAKELGK